MTEYRDPPTSDLSPQHSAAAGELRRGSELGAYSEPVLTTGDNAGPANGDSSDSSMKDKAADSAEAGKQAAGEVAQTATEKAKDVAEEAKTQARNVVGQAQDQLREQASAQHRNLVTNLRSLGDQLNAMAERSDESGQATDLVAEAGSRARSAAAWLDDREPGQLLDELRSFARRKPGVFVLGALVAGVAAGRLTRGVVASHQDDSTHSVDAGSPAHPQIATPTRSGDPRDVSITGAHSADALEATR